MKITETELRQGLRQLAEAEIPQTRGPSTAGAGSQPNNPARGVPAPGPLLRLTAALVIISLAALTLPPVRGFAQDLLRQFGGVTLTSSPAVIATIPPSPTPTAQPTASIDPALPPVYIASSDIQLIRTSTFDMGTFPFEVEEAVRACLEGYGEAAGACTSGMGEDAYPLHPVRVSAYYIEVTEVSNQQYVAFLNSARLGPNGHLDGCDGQICLRTENESVTSPVQFDGSSYSVSHRARYLPVSDVTWFGANAYCAAIGRRLPTEAEWEFAARGVTINAYPWGTEWDPALAWTNRSAPNAGAEGGPRPVYEFLLGASPFGALNMSGNVAEWVNDWYDPHYYDTVTDTQVVHAPVIDPPGPEDGEQKVIRGGSFDMSPFFARVPHRQSMYPTASTSSVGFRCVEDIVPPDVIPTLVTPSPYPTLTLTPQGPTPVMTPVG